MVFLWFSYGFPLVYQRLSGEKTAKKNTRRSEDLIQILATVPAVLQDAMALEATNQQRLGLHGRSGMLKE